MDSFSRLVTNRTSQEEVGGDSVLYQESHSSITLEEEAVETAPRLTTTDQGLCQDLIEQNVSVVPLWGETTGWWRDRMR